MRTNSSIRLAALVLAAAVFAASCSSSDDDAASESGGQGSQPPNSITEPELVGGRDAPPRPSPGCAASDATAAVLAEQHDIQVGDQQRFYLLSAAEGTGEPQPLVLDLHGLLEGAQIHAAMSGFGELAQQEGFVAAFPHGSGDPVKWEAEIATDPNPDLAYLDALLAQIGEQRCIDEARVYVTGLSYGAIMSSTLGCVRSDVFAAMAPVNGITDPQGCEPARPIPVWTTHGTVDPILLFNGGYGEVSGMLQGEIPTDLSVPEGTPETDLNGDGYPATVAAWAERNGCGEFTDTEVTDSVIRRVYECPNGAEVEFVVAVGSGHGWPGSEFSASIEQVVGPTTMDFNASEEAWEFFQRFSLPA